MAGGLLPVVRNIRFRPAMLTARTVAIAAAASIGVLLLGSYAVWNSRRRKWQHAVQAEPAHQPNQQISGSSVDEEGSSPISSMPVIDETVAESSVVGANSEVAPEEVDNDSGGSVMVQGDCTVVCHDMPSQGPGIPLASAGEVQTPYKQSMSVRGDEAPLLSSDCVSGCSFPAPNDEEPAQLTCVLAVPSSGEDTSPSRHAGAAGGTSLMPPLSPQVPPGPETDDCHTKQEARRSKGGTQQVLNFYLPTSMCGLFIGKKGKNINNLKAKSGAFIQVEALPTTRNGHLCVIKGTGEAVREAVDAIIERFPQLAPDLAGNASVDSVPVVASNVGTINVSQLQAVYINELVSDTSGTEWRDWCPDWPSPVQRGNPVLPAGRAEKQ